MKTIITAIAALFITTAAHAAPWIITGQTQLPAQSNMDNPTPSNPGAIGQVTSLPFTVPEGCRVTVYAYGMEGYNTGSGIAVLFLWTGTLPSDPAKHAAHRIAHGTGSVGAGSGSSEFTGQRLVFPEGTIINVRLINGTSLSAVYGWYVSGQINC